MNRDRAIIEVGELLANERPIDRYLCKVGPGEDDYLLLRNPNRLHAGEDAGVERYPYVLIPWDDSGASPEDLVEWATEFVARLDELAECVEGPVRNRYGILAKRGGIEGSGQDWRATRNDAK